MSNKQAKCKRKVRLKSAYCKVEYASETLILRKDDPAFNSCTQCLLNHDQCDNLCLLGGAAYHVDDIERYGVWQICRRYIAKLLHGDYNKPIFPNPFKH